MMLVTSTSVQQENPSVSRRQVCDRAGQGDAVHDPARRPSRPPYSRRTCLASRLEGSSRETCFSAFCENASVRYLPRWRYSHVDSAEFLKRGELPEHLQEGILGEVFGLRRIVVIRTQME